MHLGLKRRKEEEEKKLDYRELFHFAKTALKILILFDSDLKKSYFFFNLEES